jgi:hypothetical protein
VIQQAIARLLDGHNLTRAEARDVMGSIMSGEATPAQISGFLVALRAKGETANEIAPGCAPSPPRTPRDDVRRAPRCTFQVSPVGRARPSAYVAWRSNDWAEAQLIQAARPAHRERVNSPFQR